ncbi:hypothetical protein [Streptomyces sp. NPDC088557]|uniref:hypothetical protein n=1 Tax=Streptomyces sp. NPDC088557 TaxID=3365867 RepID=UPI00380E1E7F
MRTGTTYTRHLDLETRQHELLGLDLGEGVPRKTLVLGLALFGLWVGLLLLLLGLPTAQSSALYLIPPIFTAAVGTQRSRKTDRRRNLTVWVISARYLLLGHRPVICAGRRTATRSEWIPRHARWAQRGDALRRESVRRRRAYEADTETETAAVAGPPVVLNARPRLYGPDTVYRARQRGPKNRQEAR